MGSIPGSGRSPGVGNSNPVQYSCLENSKDRGVWRATVHGVAELDTTEHTHIHTQTIPMTSVCMRRVGFGDMDTGEKAM